MTTPTIAEIAAGLSEAQRRALSWLPDDGSWSPTRAYWQVAGQIAQFSRRSPPLTEKSIVGSNGPGNDCRWRLTPIGIQIRDFLREKEAGRG